MPTKKRSRLFIILGGCSSLSNVLSSCCIRCSSLRIPLQYYSARNAFPSLSSSSSSPCTWCICRNDQKMAAVKKQPRSWWFNSHNNPRNSPWLLSSLQELDMKTKAILELIEEDADSFMQRAELYYKKRPQLINMIEDFYLANRSLAQQYDQLKLEVKMRRNTPLGSLMSIRCWSDKLNEPIHEMSRSLYSSDSEKSEVYDSKLEVQVGSITDAVMPMNEEIDRLKVENKMLKAQVKAKDEEKREVIRQLSFPIGILIDEKASLRKCIREEPEKWGFLGLKKIRKDIVPWKLFGKLLTVVL